MSEESVMFVLGREIGEAMGACVDALADGKVNVIEGICMAKELGTLGLCAYKNKDLLKGRFMDGLDDAEEKDLTAGFAAGFDVKADQTEEMVEYYCGVGIDVAGDLSRIFLAPKAAEALPADAG